MLKFTEYLIKIFSLINLLKRVYQNNFIPSSFAERPRKLSNNTHKEIKIIVEKSKKFTPLFYPSPWHTVYWTFYYFYNPDNYHVPNHDYPKKCRWPLHFIFALHLYILPGGILNRRVGYIDYRGRLLRGNIEGERGL